MKFGICTGYENARLLKTLGYDYVELNLSAIAAMSETEFSDCRAALERRIFPPRRRMSFFQPAFA